MQRAAKEAGVRHLAAERARESEERARLRELRRQPCGAKTRGGILVSATASGAAVGAQTKRRQLRTENPEGRQRIAEAQRRRWAATS